MAWLIYNDKCPECGAEVLRHNIPRYGFCRGNCNILLDIPSYYDTEKKMLVVSRKIGEGRWEKITRDEYNALFEVIKRFCYKYFRKVEYV